MGDAVVCLLHEVHCGLRDIVRSMWSPGEELFVQPQAGSMLEEAPMFRSLVLNFPQLVTQRMSMDQIHGIDSCYPNSSKADVSTRMLFINRQWRGYSKGDSEV